MNTTTHLHANCYPALRSTIGIPDPNEVDVAPQLAIVAAARAAIAATHRVLESAHPILLATRRTDEIRNLTDAEHYAQTALDVCEQLDETLDDYTETVRENIYEDDYQNDFFF